MPLAILSGIGCTLMMPGAKENAKVALEEEVPIINISLGKGEWIAERAATYGGKILATVTNARHAKSAIDSGKASERNLRRSSERSQR